MIALNRILPPLTLLTLFVSLPACELKKVAIGTGNPLSTVATAPTGEELYASFKAALAASLQAANGERGSIEGTHTYLCSGGGQVSQTTTQSITSGTAAGIQEGTVQSKATLENCAIAMAIGGNTFAEQVTGTSEISGSLKSATLEGAVSTKYTVSGDLGFALECAAAVSVPQTADSVLYSLPVTMECKFSDDASSLSGSAADTLENAVSLPLPPT